MKIIDYTISFEFAHSFVSTLLVADLPNFHVFFVSRMSIKLTATLQNAGTFCYLPCLYSNDVLANIQITRKYTDVSLLAKHKERSVYQFISVS